MIWINVWDRVLCRFVRRLVSRTVAKAMPHVVVGALICVPTPGLPALPEIPVAPPSPIILVAPPGAIIDVIPPGGASGGWAEGPASAPHIDVPEGGWTTPGEFDHGTPITSSGFDFGHDHGLSEINVLHEKLPPLCDIPDTPPKSPVDAPGPFMWFLAACVLLFIWKGLSLQASYPHADGK